MELTINRSLLERELALLSNIVAKKDTIPALQCVLFEALDDILVLTGTDIEVTLETRLDADVRTPGKALFRAKQLADIIKSLDGEYVSFAAIPKDERILVSCGDSSFKVPVLQEEFPRLSILPSGSLGRVQSKTLAAMITRVMPCVPTVAITSNITALPGARLLFENGATQLDGTDGTRLARVHAEGEGALDGDPVKIELPRRTIEALLSLTSGADPEVLTISQNENQFLFTSPRRTLTASRLAGSLPPYDVIFSKLVDLKNLATIDVKRFKQSIKRASLMTEEARDGIVLSFSESELRFNAESGRLGEADESMPITYEGAAMDVRVNATFLTDFLGACGVPTVTAGFLSPSAPSLWTAKSDTMEYKCVLTPIYRNGPEPEPEPVKEEVKPKKRSKKSS